MTGIKYQTWLQQLIYFTESNLQLNAVAWPSQTTEDIFKCDALSPRRTMNDITSY
jgi:hypothetical protein